MRVVALLVCLLVCLLGAGVQDLGAILLTLAKMDGIPPFCPPCRSSLGALIANVALFRFLRGFLGGFGGFVWVCVACVLCVDCGALYACGVRRIKDLLRVCLSFFLFVPIFLSFSLFAYLLGLCLCCPWLVLLPALFVLVSLWVLFLFPFRYIRKKKGRKVFCALSLLGFGVFILSYLRR